MLTKNINQRKHEIETAKCGNNGIGYTMKMNNKWNIIWKIQNYNFIHSSLEENIYV